MLPNPTKSQTNTVPPTTRREEQIGPINKIRSPWKNGNNRRRLFCIPRSTYGKERQNSKNRARRQKTKRKLRKEKEKTAHAQRGGIIKPNIHRTIKKRPRPNLDLRDRP